MNKILIIEDDLPTRKLAAKVLRFEGFDTLEAANGKQGVESAFNSIPDLVICDVMMPELDGFGVLQALRNDSRTALIPFIFLTAKVTNEDRAQGMEEGADDYITKPYNPDALVRSVRRRLEKRARQIDESRLRAAEVRIAVATSAPGWNLETIDQVSTIPELLALEVAGPDTAISALDQTMAQESVRLRRMLRRLRIYVQLPQLYGGRFELAGTGPLATAGATLERAARDICQMWNREKDLVFTLQPAQLPLREEYLVLLVEELVDNACKFSAPGTAIEVHGLGHHAFWALTVRNHGAGLRADQISQIGAFKQFWTGNAKPPGLGLGLALTQGVARLHGCEFTLESTAGATTATVMVPLENSRSPFP